MKTIDLYSLNKALKQMALKQIKVAVEAFGSEYEFGDNFPQIVVYDVFSMIEVYIKKVGVDEHGVYIIGEEIESCDEVEVDIDGVSANSLFFILENMEVEIELDTQDVQDAIDGFAETLKTLTDGR